MVGLDLAADAGLRVPPRRLVTVSGRHVLLVKRFDRDGLTRIPYLSMRTLMGARDLGAIRDYGGRGGIAERLRRASPDPVRDLELLWRQAAFNILVNNTDNHLRNHGLVREGSGWSPSPVFDVEPDPDTGSMFATLFGGAAQRTTGLHGLMRIAADCGLDQGRAREVLDQVHLAVLGWRGAAARHGLDGAELDRFDHVFTGLDAAVRRIVRPG